ncbi:MAG: hypothetical protein R3F37_00160 [Candidatus Competibacteraceae bacterium]
MGKLRKYPAAPHPFLLLPPEDAPGRLQAGEEAALELTLFGHGVRYLPYVVHALGQAAAGGIGKGRGRLSLNAVWQVDDGVWSPIYRAGDQLQPLKTMTPVLPDCPDRMTVRLLTPLRLAETTTISPRRLFNSIIGSAVYCGAFRC